VESAVKQIDKRMQIVGAQLPQAYFQGATSSKLSKDKHLGKAGTTEHLDAVTKQSDRLTSSEVITTRYRAIAV
jgi:hypothetical protein